VTAAEFYGLKHGDRVRFTDPHGRVMATKTPGVWWTVEKVVNDMAHLATKFEGKDRVYSAVLRAVECDEWEKETADGH
jgi:anaerobic selenocysteine-containing dehydrogenase